MNISFYWGGNTTKRGEKERKKRPKYQHTIKPYELNIP